MNESSSTETLTFVVRLWREHRADGQQFWRGRVEHVASQEVEYIEDIAGIGHIISHWVEVSETAQDALLHRESSSPS